jgi:hypothetical protein
LDLDIAVREETEAPDAPFQVVVEFLVSNDIRLDEGVYIPFK